MLPLLRLAHAVLVGVGRAAEPEMLRRRFLGDMASLAAEAISGERFGCEERRRV